MPKLISALLLLLITASMVTAKGKTPPREILGVSIGMTQAEARNQLQKFGQLDREERRRQEVWSLKSENIFSHVILGFDPEGKVRFVTALVRPGKQALRYSDLSDLKQAKQMNAPKNFHYEWEVAPQGAQPGYIIMARGKDPNYLSIYSLKKMNPPAPSAANSTSQLKK